MYAPSMFAENFGGFSSLGLGEMDGISALHGRYPI
jgi:hypothetical protein